MKFEGGGDGGGGGGGEDDGNDEEEDDDDNNNNGSGSDHDNDMMVIMMMMIMMVITCVNHAASKKTRSLGRQHCVEPFSPISLVASIVAEIAFCKNEIKELSSSCSSSFSTSGGGRESSRDDAQIHAANAPAKIPRCMRARVRLTTTLR